MKKNNDHEIYYPFIDLPLAFSKFSYVNEDNEQEYHLLANRNGEGLLVPEMSRVDFFMIIRHYIDDEDIEHIIGGLNKLPDVQVAIKIDPTKLRSKENLVL